VLGKLGVLMDNQVFAPTGRLRRRRISIDAAGSTDIAARRSGPLPVGASTWA
jgi:hypothetical protein